MLLNDDLALILALAQAEVECPNRDEVCYQGREGFGPSGAHVLEDWSHYRVGGTDFCPTCHGTGKVPDPRFVSLVEALTEECPGCISRVCPVDGVKEYVRSCCGTGRVLRTDWPQGVLVIPLLQWSIKSGVIGLDLAEVLAKRALLAPNANGMVAERILEEMQKETTHATE